MEKLPIERISDEEYLPKVKNFGALGYSPERIADILNLAGKVRQAFIYRLTTVGDTLYQSYYSGRAIGEYNIDVGIRKKAEAGETESAVLLAERQKQREEEDLRKELFGI